MQKYVVSIRKTVCALALIACVGVLLQPHRVVAQAQQEAGVIVYIGYPDATLGMAQSDLSEVMLLNLATGDVRRLTDDNFPDEHPTVGPGGNSVVFASHRPHSEYGRGSYTQLFEVNIDTGAINRFADDLQRRYPHAVGKKNSSPAFSQDGRYLAFVSETSTARRIVVQDLETEEVEVFAPLDAILIGQIAWSPSGEHLVYLFVPNPLDSMPVPQLALLDLSSGESRLLSKPGQGTSFGGWSADGESLIVIRDSTVIEKSIDGGERVLGKYGEHVRHVVRYNNAEAIVLRYEPAEPYYTSDFYRLDLQTGQAEPITTDDYMKESASYHRR